MVPSENTHEAIISKKVFEQVQEHIAIRRKHQKDATTQIFSGLVKCADCGWSMRFGTNKQNSKHNYIGFFGRKFSICPYQNDLGEERFLSRGQEDD